MRLGRSTGHPGRASTTPEMSVTGPDGRAEPVPAWCTPHEALTRTRAAAGSNHRTCGPNHRIVTVTAAWTVRWAYRFPPRGGRGVLTAGASAASITAEALRHLSLAEDTELMSPVIRSTRKSCPVSGSGPSMTCRGWDSRHDLCAGADQPGGPGPRRDLEVHVSRHRGTALARARRDPARQGDVRGGGAVGRRGLEGRDHRGYVKRLA